MSSEHEVTSAGKHYRKIICEPAGRTVGIHSTCNLLTVFRVDTFFRTNSFDALKAVTVTRYRLHLSVRECCVANAAS